MWILAVARNHAIPRARQSGIRDDSLQRSGIQLSGEISLLICCRGNIVKFSTHAQVAPKKRAVMPLFFRSPRRRRSRIPAAKARYAADNFL
jgi:hypothetical protein